MDNGRRWRPQDQYFYHQEPPQQPQQNIRYGSAAADSVHNAQGLLAVYPMASATPTNHAVRHVSNMYTTAAPPTFAQPSYYAPRTSYPPQGNPPPYSEYDQQVRYLSSPQPPVNDGGYWTTARDNAVRILADQPPSSYRYPAQQTWRPPQGPVSSFQPSPFARSVFQRTAPPNNAYPTPSPPVMQTSSSSLAHALGPPSSMQQRPPPAPRLPPPQKVYHPDESRAFFNTFLEQKTREMKIETQPRPRPAPSPMKTPSPVKAPAPVKMPVTKLAAAALNQPSPQSSPDPLSIMTYSSPVPVTPRKRKPVVEIESPSLKRMQTMRNEYVRPAQRSSSSSVSSVPTTPSSKSVASTSSQGPTPTPKRTLNFAYVSVPRPTWTTPQARQNGFITPSMSRKKSRIGDDSPDLGGYGPVDGDGSPIKRRNITDSVKSSARRTGDRDDRAPLEKFLCLVEDIFDSEDALPSEVNISDLPDFFSSLSLDSSQPHLHSNHIRKLTKYICQVARPNQRIRNTTTGVMNTPRAQGRMAQVDTQVLSRLLKVLDRSVKTGEDLDPFKYVTPPTGPPKSSPRKKVAKAKKQDASQPQPAKEGSDDIADQDTDRKSAEEEDREPEKELDRTDYEQLARSLNIARESILAADCCIALLGSDRLTKQLYSEELIISCFNAVKNQLEKIIYPFVEASIGMGFEFSGNPVLRFVVQDNSSTASSHRKQLSELFQALSSVIPRINNLVNAETVAMSDAIIISAVYIAIGPFFVVEGEGESKGKKEKDNIVLKTFGKSAMRGLRLDALGLIRSIFANHESQRSWIIEEILTSLIKLSDTKQKAGQFRLRDGRSIRTVSALLLQLVQTSAHDVRLKARKIEKNRQNQLALKRQESFSESQQAQEPFLDENDHEEIVLYKGGLDSAMQAAKTIIGFLTKRSGKGKTTKNSNEAEYRAIFDNLIGDLLVVLFWPEWPAAGVLLTMICRYMVNALSEKHSHAQFDSNAAKTMALDHLGVIAAKIRSATLKFQVKADEEVKVRPLKSMDEVVAGQDVKAFEHLLKAHRDVTTHIARRSSEDQAYDSARELSAAILGQELATALQQLQKWIEMPDFEDDLDLKDPRDTNKMLTFGRKVRGALRDVWKDPPTDVFDVGSQEEVDRIDQLGEQIGTLQTMRSSFDPILNTIVGSLNASVIFIRTKALRALGQIVTSDPAVLSMPIVRRGIENHLLDSSPAVRDAAVELIGKYMIDSPEVAGNYYQKIADRMADTGLGVRKRVIKLLKSFYNVTQDNNCKIDIATRMVARMMDEDDTVKELAIKTIEELWFPTASTTTVNTRTKSASAGHHQSDKNSILAKVIVIMGTAAHFKERQSPLEDLLHKIMAEKPENEVPALHARYSEICETLIDGLVDATDMPGFTVVNCIRTIYLFTSAYPPVLSGSNASTLLPYLKSTSTNEELITTDYLLKIFRVSIPHMPPTAGKFGQDLQLALQPMIIKPSGSGGVQILQEAVGCMCVVVQHLTHDFIRLVNLLKSCNARLQQAIKRPTAAQMEDKETRPLVILILIVALLGEHCKFDQLRTENKDIAKDIDGISQGSIIEHIYDTLLQLYQKYHDSPMLRGRTLQCLGFLFRAQPTLMTKERSASVMDAIFASPDEDGKGRILRIMQEFLVSESEKSSAKLKETTKAKSSKATDVNMDELVGNTDGFADSGVSSAIVQRYLDPVLEAALSPASPNQGAAVDVLSFTIKQGLAHPLQSFPVIVALETSPVTSLSNRATALHSILQGKHASLLNTRYIVSARASFEYQKKVAGSQDVKGYRTEPSPVALLQRWFSLVREKRVQRQEFLKSLVKVFQENSDYQSTQDDVDFMRYMVENFAMFDYKTQEELLEMISPSHLLSQLHVPLKSTSESASQTNPDTNAMAVDPPSEPQTASTVPIPDGDNLDKLPLMRTSVIIAMVMLLKAHLKSLYSISEEKCNKFVVGKKSAAGDKPATRRNDKPISWSRLPYAASSMLTTEDIKIQRARFLDIWNEDGVTAEPDDELEFS